MKRKSKKNMLTLLAIGLLLMNGLAVINSIFNTHINSDIIDFLKGMAMPIILWSAYHMTKIPAENTGNCSQTPKK
jgi:hypothetical protein